MKWADGYKIKNTIKSFEETKKYLEARQKTMSSRIKYLNELQDKLDNHDCHLSPNDSCDCYILRSHIKDIKEQLHDELISNETDDLLLNTHC